VDQWLKSSRAPGIGTINSDATVGEVPSLLEMEVNSCHRAQLPLQMDQGILKHQQQVDRALFNHLQNLYQGLLNCQRQMAAGLSFSLPYTDITVSYKKGRLTHTYIIHDTLLTLCYCDMFRPSKAVFRLYD